ncbi:hypothetical protein N7541_008380 [Penicillium brevicompactum]|uniref:Uncharacterized protein n=1 Tax=Penicillium brevicompactum TaxID=5074 RepID=A0A9W9R4K5_PENBR|nr:hypothetical protein N7541_008380 [Penicillium brevicompactum]
MFAKVCQCIGRICTCGRNSESPPGRSTLRDAIELRGGVMGTHRRPHRPREAGEPVNTAPNAVVSMRVPVPTDVAAQQSDTSSADRIYAHPATELTRFRTEGARLQAWIEDANVPGCRVQPVTLTSLQFDERFDVRAYDLDAWPSQILDGGDVASAGIPMDATKYRAIEAIPHDLENDFDQYTHLQTKGTIIAQCVYHTRGPHWNEVATVLYERTINADIQTLRNIVLTNVVNDETMALVKFNLYPRRNLSWQIPEDGEPFRANPCEKFERGTREYEELLGTQLIKATACLVISAFPRGTMMISRIVTWNEFAKLNIRLEIAPRTN